MNFIKYVVSLFLLTVGLTSKAELYCYTNSAQQNDGTISLKITDPSSYYNGVITLTGGKLLSYFSNELKSLKAKCYFNGGYGVNNNACEVHARLNLQTKEIFVGGRYETGLKGFSDSGGLKLLTTFNGSPSGKNWFFNNCLQN